jgi:holin-like protein
MSFINGITLLLIYQLIGETTVLLLDIPVPGPVVGMLLLFATLLLRGEGGESLQTTASLLLNNLSLLFVPAGVGMLVHLDLIAAQWLPILLTLILSTLITLSASAAIMWLATRLISRRS